MSEQQKYLSYEGLQEYDARIKKYIDQDVSTMQSDWNQNDESAPDYIKNKPEFAKDEDVVIMLSELEFIMPVLSVNNEAYTTEDGKIYTF